MERLSQQSPATASDEVSFLGILLVLAVYKRLIVGGTTLVAALAAVASLLMPNIYTGTAIILPPQQAQSSASAMLGQLVGGGAGGVASALGLKNPNDLYVAMLKSNNVEDRLVERFGLMKRYESILLSDARRTLEESTAINAGKDGLIKIEVSDRDPMIAADIANAYVDELKRLTRVLAVSEASQRRLFYETEVKKVKDQLTEAEFALKKGLDSKGIVMADAQGTAMIETVARLRAQISTKEIQLGTMRAFATSENPEFRLVQQELSSMRGELAQLEGRAPSADKASETSSKGSSGLDNLKRLRDVKYYSALYEFLAKQYEVSRIDEAKEATLIQVLDPATPPERKSKPKRALIVMLSTIAAFMLLILVAFVRNALAKSASDPNKAHQFITLRRALTWRITKPSYPNRC